MQGLFHLSKRWQRKRRVLPEMLDGAFIFPFTLLERKGKRNSRDAENVGFGVRSGFEFLFYHLLAP